MPPPPDVFSLDARELRYARLEAGADGATLAGYRWQELPPESFHDGPLGGAVRDPRALQEMVVAFVRSASTPIREASLVLPDAWLRLTFCEVGELPRKQREIDEVIRFKLKRQVPFRVEDLRVAATEVRPFPNQDEPRRLLLGFALENLVAQLEAIFAAAGITLGRISNSTLALLASLEEGVGEDSLAALVGVEDDAFTVSFVRAGEPLLYRFKAFTPEMPPEVRAGSVHRDLRLTLSFMREHFPELPLERVFLAAPPFAEEQWLTWLGEELALRPEPLRGEHFPGATALGGASWTETAPLLGAARLEVA